MADEQTPTTAASKQEGRSGSRALGASPSAHDLRCAGSTDMIPFMPGSTYQAPVRDLSGSGVGPGTRKHTSSVRGPVSRELFDDDLGEVSKDLPSKAVSDDDCLAVDDGSSRVKRRRVSRFRNDECVAMKGVLKNKIESLEEQVKRERGSVEVYTKLNNSLEESCRNAALDMVDAESRVLSLQEEVSKLLLTIASGEDINVSINRNDARTRKGKKMLETRVEKRRSKAPSKTEYRDRTWRELQSLERQEN